MYIPDRIIAIVNDKNRLRRQRDISKICDRENRITIGTLFSNPAFQEEGSSSAAVEADQKWGVG